MTTRDRHALPPSIIGASALTTDSAAAPKTAGPRTREPRVSADVAFLGVDADEDTHSSRKYSASTTAESFLGVAVPPGDLDADGEPLMASHPRRAMDDDEGPRMMFRQNIFGVPRWDQFGDGEIRDSIELARERRENAFITDEEVGTVFDCSGGANKRRWSQRMSGTVVDLGRRLKRSMSSWLDTRKDSRMSTGSRHGGRSRNSGVEGMVSTPPDGCATPYFQMDDGAPLVRFSRTQSTATDRMASMPNYDADDEESDHAQCIRGGSSVTMSELRPAHHDWTPPEAERPKNCEIEKGQPFLRELGLALGAAEKNRALHPLTIASKYDSALGNNTTELDQMRAAIELREAARREQRRRDAAFERECKQSNRLGLQWPRRWSDVEAKPPLRDDDESAASYGAEIATAAGVVMRQRSGTIALPL